MWGNRFSILQAVLKYGRILLAWFAENLGLDGLLCRYETRRMLWRFLRVLRWMLTIACLILLFFVGFQHHFLSFLYCLFLLSNRLSCFFKRNIGLSCLLCSALHLRFFLLLYCTGWWSLTFGIICLQFSIFSSFQQVICCTCLAVWKREGKVLQAVDTFQGSGYYP